MVLIPRALRPLVFLFPLALFAGPLPAQDIPGVDEEQNGETEALPRPASLQDESDVPWLYEGSNVPVDRDWKFGVLDNGLRYAVRRNGVPPQQVSIRIRMDVGALHERDEERGFAHLLEHLLFRESRHLGPGEAIPTWQRLGASFGNDTNAVTSPTSTVYQLDMPEASPDKLDQSFKLLAGMIQEPILNPTNLTTEVPIVLAERRESGGAIRRVSDARRETLFAGQRLAVRSTIGTEATLRGATAEALSEFHRLWYRPEKTVIAVAGDADPEELARLIETYFGDWQGVGEGGVEPDFGDPVAPAGAVGSPPVGEAAVLVEPDLPRTMTYAIMRPWRPVVDTIVYNEGLLMDGLALQIINRRLESRARSGGSFLYAQVEQDDISRSTDATLVSFAPLTEDWEGALTDVRSVLADALANAPTQEEIDREVAEFDVGYQGLVDEAPVAAGSRLADNFVEAIDIRETTAAPQAVLDIFRGMKTRITPEAILARSKALFEGDVVRSILLTPEQGDADATRLAAALGSDVTPDGSARLAAKSVSFDEQPAIGKPGTVVSSRALGDYFDFMREIQVLELSNGVRVQLWPNTAEPGRVAVRVRFGSGRRAFTPKTAAYASLGEGALIGSGLGELGQEEIDRISTGRKLGFDFSVLDTVFQFDAQTRKEDLTDQLYLFAAKLGMPRWDANPVIREQAESRLAYESFITSPTGLLTRDLDFYLAGQDPRYATPDPDAIAGTSVEEFRKVWEPLLQQGPIEVLVYGEFDGDEAIDTLRKTFGALPTRTPIPADVASRVPGFPETGKNTVLKHRGDAEQAAAVISWPSGGGIDKVRESRQLEILSRLFSNRLLDSLRERTGSSYAPFVRNDWPLDMETGGTISAIAQVSPDLVPAFFAEAEAIAADLAANPPSQDELDRVIEPLKQLVTRASSGNGFWLYQFEGASYDQRFVDAVPSILFDYTNTTPAAMQALAKRYLTARPGYRLAIIPEGQELAEAAPAPATKAASPMQGLSGR